MLCMEQKQVVNLLLVSPKFGFTKEEIMPINLPKWATNAAFVAMIFAAGGYVARLETGLNKMDNSIRDMETRIVKIETAISIHHGNDWTEKIDNKTLKRVDEIEKTIGGISSKIDSSFNSTVQNVNDLDNRIKAIHLWTRQGDEIIKRSRLEQFRAIAVYSTSSPENYKRIFINKQHKKGGNFRKGDTVLLINPLPPGLQVEATVEGFLDDPNSPNILVQFNLKLLKDLNLDPKEGKYELFVQNKPQSLRWMTLDECMNEIIRK